MSTENVQLGQAADGHGIVLIVPTIANPTAPTVDELTGETVKKITYGLAPDGFDHQTSVATITTGRYTLDQALELDGIITDTVVLKYVYNRDTPTDVELAVGEPGTTGFLVKMLGYPNGHVITAADVVNAIIPFKSSVAIDVPPTQNSELLKQQKLNVTGKVQREVAVVAGA
jgi:hypothetical protein